MEKLKRGQTEGAGPNGLHDDGSHERAGWSPRVGERVARVQAGVNR